MSIAGSVLTLGADPAATSAIQSIRVFQYDVFRARLRLSSPNTGVFGFNEIGNPNNVGLWNLPCS
jgi:hypothetical protein